VANLTKFGKQILGTARELGVSNAAVRRRRKHYLWHEKGFIGFMKLGDEIGFEELTNIVCSVATRENLRCTKQIGSIKTWAFFKKEMVG